MAEKRCSYCSAKLRDGDTTCLRCGRPTGSHAPTHTPEGAAAQASTSGNASASTSPINPIQSAATPITNVEAVKQGVFIMHPETSVPIESTTPSSSGATTSVTDIITPSPHVTTLVDNNLASTTKTSVSNPTSPSPNVTTSINTITPISDVPIPSLDASSTIQVNSSIADYRFILKKGPGGIMSPKAVSPYTTGGGLPPTSIGGAKIVALLKVMTVAAVLMVTVTLPFSSSSPKLLKASASGASTPKAVTVSTSTPTPPIALSSTLTPTAIPTQPASVPTPTLTATSVPPTLTSTPTPPQIIPKPTLPAKPVPPVVTSTPTPTSVPPSPTATSLPSAPTSAPGPQTLQVTSPNVAGILFGIVALSASDAWATGYSETDNKQVHVLVEHWNGANWNIVSTPAIGTDSWLPNIVAIAPNDIWAVGDQDDGNGNHRKTLIEHWDGKNWNIVQSQSPGIDNTLAGVSVISSNDIWAVGGYSLDGNDNHFHSLAEHWDGANWSIVPTPDLPGLNSMISVTGFSSNDVWATAGSSTIDINHTQALFEHWNGTKWSIFSSPTPGNEYSLFEHIAGRNANDIWAVGGYANTNEIPRGFTVHWDGKTWSQVSAASTGQASETGEDFLESIAVGADKSLCAVGDYTSKTGNATNGGAQIQCWDGQQWHIVPSLSPGSTISSLYGISFIPGTTQFWSVGDYQNGDQNALTLIEKTQM